MQTFEVMLSHIFTQFFVLIGQTTITLLFMFLVFKIPCHGPIGLIVLITILQGFAGMCFGKYRKVGSSKSSRLEAHAGFFRLFMKWIFDPYVLWPFTLSPTSPG